MAESTKQREGGYVLIAFLVVVVIGLMIASMSLDLASSGARTISASRARSHEYYEAETTIYRMISWLRANSQNMVYPFSRNNFYTNFSRAAVPSVGTNDIAGNGVPTKIKLFNSTNSVVLSSHSMLGVSNFPNSQHITSGAAFNTNATFAAAGLGPTELRATLIDALPVDPSLDYGPPPAAAPGTDFYPIYRLETLNNLTQGTRILGYLVGSLYYIDTVGFYGRDFVEVRQSCDSYISANGAYSSAVKRAKCPVGSNNEIRIHQNEQIYGSARTNGAFNNANPYGGKVCADFVANCPNAGSTCAGGTCAVPPLPSFSPWATYCPSDQGNRTVSSNQTWVLGGGSPAQNCWNTVTVNTNRTLTLSSTTYPYYIKTLTLTNNSNSRLQIQPSPANGTVTLYVETITGNSINGNQSINTSNRPSQFRLYYLGASSLTLNGNANMNVAIVAPNAGISVLGNFDFHGGIMATDLTFQGAGKLHYDESLGGSSLNDVTYRLKNEGQFYQ